MKLEKLLENLNNPKTQSRQAAVFILGMIDEVQAIDALRKRYARESNHQVKQAMQVVGGQLAKLKREGYDTVEAICEYFNINKELQSIAAKDEETAIRDIQSQTKNTRKDDDFDDQMWGAAAAALQIGAMSAGIGGTLSMNPANVDMTSNISDTSEQIKRQNKRIPPTRPGTDNIAIWIEQLQTETDPLTKIQIMIQLMNMHNLAALPYLANVHWTDSDEQVKAAAKKCGKVLYLNACYWEMVQNGTMQEVMEAKAALLGVTLPEENTIQVEQPRRAHNQSLDDILAAAEARRKKKRR